MAQAILATDSVLEAVQKLSLAPRTTLTRDEVSAHLPRDIAQLAVQFCMARSRDWYCIARAGEFETCQIVNAASADACLAGACRGGLSRIADLAIAAGATDADCAFRNACMGGHLALAIRMVQRGASDLAIGYLSAALCSQLHITAYFKTRGFVVRTGEGSSFASRNGARFARVTIRQHEMVAGTVHADVNVAE